MIAFQHWLSSPASTIFRWAFLVAAPSSVLSLILSNGYFQPSPWTSATTTLSLCSDNSAAKRGGAIRIESSQLQGHRHQPQVVVPHPSPPLGEVLVSPAAASRAPGPHASPPLDPSQEHTHVLLCLLLQRNKRHGSWSWSLHPCLESAHVSCHSRSSEVFTHHCPTSLCSPGHTVPSPPPGGCSSRKKGCLR